METILVTGGAGFVGSHLVRRLLGEGRRVVCVDNLRTGSRDNIRELESNDDFIFIEHDVTEPYVPEEEIHEIYHLASPASPVQYQKDPIFTFWTNVAGTRNMLELAVAHDIPLLQASTSEIYGNPLEHPQTESYWGNVNPIGPRSCYDEGKRAAETLCMDYTRGRNAKVRIVRIFNTYGPRMAKDDGRVISNFIVQALAGKDITVYGDGVQTRSFQYIDDLVEGIVRVMERGVEGPVNLGNPGEYTILELAEKIITLTDSKSRIVRKPLPEDDPVRRKPDITKAKELLGWEPKVSLEEGLEKTIAHFRASG